MRSTTEPDCSFLCNISAVTSILRYVNNSTRLFSDFLVTQRAAGATFRANGTTVSVVNERAQHVGNGKCLI